MDKRKENRIAQMLRDGYGIRKICREEGISNTAIYTIGEKTGTFHKQSMNTVPKSVMVDDFKCPGLTGCVTCKRQFQYPCPMWAKDF